MLNTKIFNSKTALCSYTSDVWRMVETQETAATLNIVDNMDEQALLEELLDQVKPPYRTGTKNMHYLLKTAFRYPPLKYGSRFGTRIMPSFFYASEQAQTALAETAYYRFVLLNDMQEPYPHEVDSRHSLFRVSIKTTKCLDLLSSEFNAIHPRLIDPSDYSLSQSIGNWAVNKEGVEAIRFESARDKGSANIAVAEPRAISSRAPTKTQSWLCRTANQRISFSCREVPFPYTFTFEDFSVDGTLPRPN